MLKNFFLTYYNFLKFLLEKYINLLSIKEFNNTDAKIVTPIPKKIKKQDSNPSKIKE